LEGDPLAKKKKVSAQRRLRMQLEKDKPDKRARPAATPSRASLAVNKEYRALLKEELRSSKGSTTKKRRGRKRS
jgi:hypothetical protein